jgi:hypothetical protein
MTRRSWFGWLCGAVTALMGRRKPDPERWYDPEAGTVSGISSVARGWSKPLAEMTLTEFQDEINRVADEARQKCRHGIWIVKCEECLTPGIFVEGS